MGKVEMYAQSRCNAVEVSCNRYGDKMASPDRKHKLKHEA